MATNSSSSSKDTVVNFNPAVAHKRKERDVMKLLMSDYKVIQSKENPYDFLVDFEGPKGSLYEGGTWKVHVLLPEAYPYKSPSIGFSNKIYHPNVDEASGSVCLDVINQTWSPMFDLINIFDTFLPQLLLYPNPKDPLNPEAASQMLKDIEKYEKKVKEYVKKYANGKSEVSKEITVEKDQNEEKIEEEQEEEQIDIENNEDSISLSDVSELSETSDIGIVEE